MKKIRSQHNSVKSNPFFRILKGKVVLVGIGNTMRGDDGLGPALIAGLRDRVQAVCIDAGSAPENYLGKILREHPDTLLLIDAVHLNSMPGDYEILKPGELVRAGITTHDIPLPMLVEFVASQTNVQIYVLAVQPLDTGFGKELSQPVKKSLLALERLVVEAIPEKKFLL